MIERPKHMILFASGVSFCIMILAATVYLVPRSVLGFLHVSLHWILKNQPCKVGIIYPTLQARKRRVRDVK